VVSLIFAAQLSRALKGAQAAVSRLKLALSQKNNSGSSSWSYAAYVEAACHLPMDKTALCADERVKRSGFARDGH
jgi:hypothetical protein